MQGQPVAAERIPVAVLGATGLVGQRICALLEDHPWFDLVAVAASARSAGKSYAKACRWHLDRPMHSRLAALPVLSLEEEIPAAVIFSALDASVAFEAEEAEASRGRLVVSNARSHRMEPDVPLVVPEVNADHLRLCALQADRFPSGGRIITNPNCSTIGLVIALAPLHRRFGLREVHVTTLQAISGAGYPGVPALDLADNVIPGIPGEEEKLETESLKILGTLSKPSRLVLAEFALSASVHRVAVSEGHLLSIAATFEKEATPEEVSEAMRSFPPVDLPTAPEWPIRVLGEEHRPQPSRDRGAGRGMTVSIGRIRRDPLFTIKMSVLVHNTLRGAAGAALLNAELAVAERRREGGRIQLEAAGDERDFEEPVFPR